MSGLDCLHFDSSLDFNSYLFNVEWKGFYYPYNEIDSMKDVYNRAHAYNTKVSRLFKRCVYAQCRFKYSYFITLTFNDLHLNSSSASSKISRSIKRCLQPLSSYYLYNKDFGDLNNRLHYHCLLWSNCKINSLNWNYGFYNLKLINDFNRSLAKYMVKYCLHSAKNGVVYYSFKGYDNFNNEIAKKMFIRDKKKLDL